MHIPERWEPVAQLDSGDSHGPDVGAAAVAGVGVALARDDLGGHPVGRADARLTLAHLTLDHACKAEIDELHLAFAAQHDVARPDVAV